MYWVAQLVFIIVDVFLPAICLNHVSGFRPIEISFVSTNFVSFQVAFVHTRTQFYCLYLWGLFIIVAASWLGQSTSTMKFFQRALLCFFGTEPVSFYFGLTNKWALLYKRVLIAHPWSRYLPPSTRIQLHVSFLCSFVSPNIFLVLTFNLFQFNHVMLAMREKLA